MRRRLPIVATLALATVLLLALWQPWASGATEHQINLAAAAFSGRDYSSHNNNTTQICGAQVALVNGGENTGDLDNAQGSYFAYVRIPDGTTVTRLRLYVNDADNDDDAHAYLLRQRIIPDLSTTAGFKTMGEAHSNGAVTNKIRRFSDNTIDSGGVDNAEFMYYVEIVDCGVPEPFAVQVVYE